MKIASTFRRLVLAGSAIAALSALVAPSKAEAWWRGGLWVGVPGPLYFAPPVYAPPPVYYAPPPVVYAPPPFYVSPPARYSSTCYAGPYTCPMESAGAAGSPCSCPANQGRVYGRAG
jgi:hypothetical protein